MGAAFVFAVRTTCCWHLRCSSLFAAGIFCARAPRCLAGLLLAALPCLRAVLQLLDETRGQAGARLGARFLVQRGEMVLNSAQAHAQLCCDVLERPLIRDHCSENVAFPFRESIRFAKAARTSSGLRGEACSGILGRASPHSHGRAFLRRLLIFQNTTRCALHNRGRAFLRASSR